MTDQLWQSVLGEIELSVSRGSFVTWFKNTSLLKENEGIVTIGVPNIFIKHQLETKFSQLIKDMLEKNGIMTRELEFKIHMSKPDAGATPSLPSLETTISSPTKTTTTDTAFNRPRSITLRPALNEKYTFDSFIVGSGNDLAYAACQAIVKNPGTKYNPLFVYGGSGLGKTHLIQAVGNGIKMERPDITVVYISCETFVNEFLDSVRNKKTGFSERYRSADVLIIDDIQFIAGKEKTQEEFFHTFNALHQSDKQIIISSDKPPKAIPTLEERLRSRFEWGMTIDIQPPDFETRYAILQTKAQQHNIDLPNEVTEYLANLIQTNVRELEGALNQLLAYCEMHEISPDLQITTSLIGGGRIRPKHLTPKQVIEVTAKHFHMEIDDIVGPKRDKDIVVPRQIAMYLLRSELHFSFPKVAHELGRKDHTTAIHSVDKIEKGLQFNQVIRQHIQDIKERLYA